MTEAEWRTETDPEQMLNFLGAVPSDRKLRLYACACCHHRTGLLTEPHHFRILTVAEQLAEGLATPEQLQAERENLFASDYALWAATQVDPYSSALTGSKDIAIHAWQDGSALVSNDAPLDESRSRQETQLISQRQHIKRFLSATSSATRSAP